jgi:hypothetical protein
MDERVADIEKYAADFLLAGNGLWHLVLHP